MKGQRKKQIPNGIDPEIGAIAAAAEPAPVVPVPRTEKTVLRSLTSKVHEDIVLAISAGAHPNEAAKYVGVSVSTFHEWLARGRGTDDRPAYEEYVTFAQDVEKAEAAGEISAVAAVRGASKHDWRAAAWILERRYPERWAATQKIEVLVDRRVEQELSLFFDVLMNDTELSSEAKARILEIAENLGDRQAMAGEN